MKRSIGVVPALALALLATAAQAAAPAYTVADLGTLRGPTSRALTISPNGQVAGQSETAAGPYHAFLWTRTGGMVDLGTLGGETSAARGVNSFGQVVGDSSLVTGRGHAFLWTKAAGMRDLGTLSGDVLSSAQAVNDKGQVVGYSGDDLGHAHAFIWTPGRGMRSLTAQLGGGDSAAEAISADGDIAGWYRVPAGGVQRAFALLHTGRFIDLGLEHSAATAISPDGTVVGGSYTTGPFPSAQRARMMFVTHAFVWTREGGVVNVPGLQNSQATSVTGVNDAEEVVAASETDRGLYWTPADGTTELVTDGAPPNGFAQPSAINNTGQIAGHDYAGHATLWTPPAARTYMHLTVPPALSGLVQVGGTLTADRGTWTGAQPRIFRARWLVSHDGGVTWAPASTGWRWRLPASSLGALVKVTLTATGTAGTATVESGGVGPVGAAVLNLEPPAVSGLAHAGHRLVADRGTWSGVSLTYAYRWYASGDGGATWTQLARTGSPRYVLPARTLGAIVRVDVTAANVWGSLTVSSPPTGVVTR